MTMKVKRFIIGLGVHKQLYAVNVSQAIVAGSLVVISSGKLSVAAATAVAGTVVGVAMEAKTTLSGAVPATDVVYVDDNPGTIYTMPYTAGTKTAVTDADLGTRFDLVTNAYTVALDDTTGGYLKCVGYNNTDGTMDVQIMNREV
jgi:hypothetical protein